MAFKSSAGTTPYQPAPSIQPKYGFRYSGSTFAPSMSPANVPPVNYTIPAYEAPTVAPTPYANNGPMTCLLYTSPSPRDRTRSRMPSSA